VDPQIGPKVFVIMKLPMITKGLVSPATQKPS
jgi:hypothetical protein